VKLGNQERKIFVQPKDFVRALTVITPEKSEVRETKRRVVDKGCCHGSEGKWHKTEKKSSSKWLITLNLRIDHE
jgi:guanyl-specific ribonuclease Sa